jgi:hypothetical protein
MQVKRKLQEYHLFLDVKEFAEAARLLSFSGCDQKSFLSCKTGKFCYRFGLFYHNGCLKGGDGAYSCFFAKYFTYKSLTDW